MPRHLALVLLCVAACEGRCRQPLDPPSALQPVVSVVPDRAPLRTWMKSELLHRLKQADFDRLASAFDALAALRPPGLERWEMLARDGARAAHAHDLEAVRGVCLSCHRDYRARYRETLRSLPIGALRGNS